MADLDLYMKKMGEELDLPLPFEANSKGIYTIPLEEDLNVFVSKHDSGISATAEVGDCPPYKRDLLFSELLHANLFGQGTEHAIFGINKNSTKVNLSLHIEHQINYDEFIIQMENFINVLDFWRNELTLFK